MFILFITCNQNNDKYNFVKKLTQIILSKQNYLMLKQVSYSNQFIIEVLVNVYEKIEIMNWWFCYVIVLTKKVKYHLKYKSFSL